MENSPAVVMESEMDLENSRKRGRPRLYPENTDSYAKTGVIRKPIYLMKNVDASSEDDDAPTAVSSPEVDSDVPRDIEQPESPVSAASSQPVSKVFISVEGFKKRGPKPGQKRDKYKKRKKQVKRKEKAPVE